MQGDISDTSLTPNEGQPLTYDGMKLRQVYDCPEDSTACE
jgi:hypothetical protein